MSRIFYIFCSLTIFANLYFFGLATMGGLFVDLVAAGIIISVVATIVALSAVFLLQDALDFFMREFLPVARED